MPNKLQLKLISNSGELLSVVNCLAGKISVLRASVPSDLRPYQRALSGSPGKDNLVVTCDGNEYRAENHVIMGFGEPSPTAGMSVREFLAKSDVHDSAADALLLQIGLENVSEKKCSDLSADQEARLRLLAATTDPERMLILNDPFENISGQWRERAADLLATFARTRKALIVIPSLSYRPESWIDNQSVERIEVGQTTQRTIGFGAAGSQSNALINEIRDRVRQEHPQATPTSERATLATAALGGVVTSTDDPQDITRQRRWSPAAKVATAVLGAGLSVWVAVSTLPSTEISAPTDTANAKRAQATQPKVEDGKSAPLPADASSKRGAEEVPANEGAVAKVANVQQTGPQKSVSEDFALDNYPNAIKVSLLDTARGVVSFKSSGGESIPPIQAQNDKSGNLFSLLESASSKSPSSPAASEELDTASSYNEADEPVGMEAEPVNASEEESRREEIRNRFLEAIRAAAERRQAETDIEEP
jgi:hypothetical protein